MCFGCSLQCSGSGPLYLHKQVRVVFSPLPPDVYEVSTERHQLVVDTLGPHLSIATCTQVPQSSELELTRTQLADMTSLAPRHASNLISHSSILSKQVKGVHPPAVTTTGPLLSREEMFRKKQEAAAEVAAKTRGTTPPPFRVP